MLLIRSCIIWIWEFAFFLVFCWFPRICVWAWWCLRFDAASITSLCLFRLLDRVKGIMRLCTWWFSRLLARYYSRIRHSQLCFILIQTDIRRTYVFYLLFAIILCANFLEWKCLSLLKYIIWIAFLDLACFSLLHGWFHCALQSRPLCHSVFLAKHPRWPLGNSLSKWHFVMLIVTIKVISTATLAMFILQFRTVIKFCDAQIVEVFIFTIHLSHRIFWPLLISVLF